MLQDLWGGQRATLWSWFPPFTFMWVLGRKPWGDRFMLQVSFLAESDPWPLVLLLLLLDFHVFQATL